MAESQTQVKPQFIMWAKEAGVFRPARIRMHENYIGHDLERNVEFLERNTELAADGDLSPDALNLVGSVYLGPINIYEEQLGNIIPKDAFERYREHKHGIVRRIMGLAEKAAQEQGVQYFGLNVVQTEKDRTWKFRQFDEVFIDRFEKYSFNKNPETFDKTITKPLEFVLHPTAQLYVPRR